MHKNEWLIIFIFTASIVAFLHYFIKPRNLKLYNVVACSLVCILFVYLVINGKFLFSIGVIIFIPLIIYYWKEYRINKKSKK